MAYVVRTYKCEDCGLERDEMQDSKDFTPPECPHCTSGEPMGGPIPSTTAIGGFHASKATDKLWKDIQEGGDIRAEATGDNSQKITDMPDGFYGGGLKPGDSTAPKINNPVTNYVAETGFQMWGQGGGTMPMNPATAAAAGKAAHAGKKSGAAIDHLTGVVQGGGPMAFPTRQVQRPR